MDPIRDSGACPQHNVVAETVGGSENTSRPVLMQFFSLKMVHHSFPEVPRLGSSTFFMRDFSKFECAMVDEQSHDLGEQTLISQHMKSLPTILGYFSQNIPPGTKIGLYDHWARNGVEQLTC